jgi:hypothetical protein
MPGRPKEIPHNLIERETDRSKSRIARSARFLLVLNIEKKHA